MKGRNALPDGVKSPPAEPLPVPDVPAALARNDHAKVEWERLAPLLANTGALADIDTTALQTYCECYSHYRRAEEFLAEWGDYDPDTGRPRAALKVAENFAKQCRAFYAEFGLTPSARGKGKLPAAPKKETSEVLNFSDD